MTHKIGILTAGSDCPGLNAAIRAIGKAARSSVDWDVIGFKDGFHGLIHDQTINLSGTALSGILTAGGTILGTSRELPHQATVDNKVQDATEKAVQTYKNHKLAALICIGGRETQESGLRLSQAGLNIVTLPKAVDNDLAETDWAIGFDTALSVATEAVDRLHSTATSSHRIIIVETMGRDAGWLALGSGLSGGADVILIPEIAYDIQIVADAIQRRNQAGRRFSIIAVSEGALPKEYAEFYERSRQTNEMLRAGEERQRVARELDRFEKRSTDNANLLASRLEKLTGLSTRITILGYLLRGGIPSAADRLLATQLGTMSINLVKDGCFGRMVALRNGKVEPVPLDSVHDFHKRVPLDHSWILGARNVGTVFGD